MTFWIAWSIDAIAAIVFVAFFIIGLVDGSVSSFNIGLWLLVLGVLGGVVLGGLTLRSSARKAVATTLVTVLAVPTALTGLFFLAVVLIPARWN